MFDKLRKILEKIDADYSDIRYEIKKQATISFSGKELTEIGSNATDGFVIRVLKNGGFSSVVFTRADDADKAIQSAIENAVLIGKNIDKPVKLADVEPVKDKFIPELNEDPREISMEEKLALIRKYNDIPLSFDKMANTDVNYEEIIREKYFISSEGAEIREDLITTALHGELMAKDGNLLQNVRIRGGGSDGFTNIRNLEGHMEERSKVVLDLLKAKPAVGGTYGCILNPNLAGVFAHEAFGHFSEADIIEALPAMREKMKLGNKLGSEVVNIVDDASLPAQLGFYNYDDEGVPVRKTELMKKGVLVGRLHSRRTAAEFDEPISGHCVAEDFRYAPIIRMGTTYIEPAENSFDDLLQMLGDGLYILDAKGGQTSGENFTFGAQYGYEIKNGKLAGMVRDLNVSGNLYNTLDNIQAVGNDLTLSKIGGCGKGQLNRRSCNGGPHILVNNLVVGGV